MRTMIRLTMAAAAIALGAAAIQPAHAADMLVPQAQAPAPAYYPPPAAGLRLSAATTSRRVLSAPPPVAYYAPAYECAGRGLLCAPGPYWRGYGPRFAYGYGPLCDWPLGPLAGIAS